MATIKQPTEATAVPTNVSTEGVALTMANVGGVVQSAPIGVAMPTGVAKNTITGDMNITAGAGTTAVVIRCRQNGVAGAQVGQTKTVTLAAAATGDIPFNFIDPAPAVSQTYVITVQQTGGTGAGTVNDIVAYALDSN